MPLYDFVCEDGHAMEVTCGSDEVEKLVVACKSDGCNARASYQMTFGGLDHGIGIFRDAAREDRFDEDNLSTRWMSSGRGSWRR